MTNAEHFELSRKLALAFGWKDCDEDMCASEYSERLLCNDRKMGSYRIFDYRDPVVAMAAMKQFVFGADQFHQVVTLDEKRNSGKTLEQAIAECAIEAQEQSLAAMASPVQGPTGKTGAGL